MAKAQQGFLAAKRCAIKDAAKPTRSGLEAAAAIKAECPPLPGHTPLTAFRANNRVVSVRPSDNLYIKSLAPKLPSCSPTWGAHPPPPSAAPSCPAAPASAGESRHAAWSASGASRRGSALAPADHRAALEDRNMAGEMATWGPQRSTADHCSLTCGSPFWSTRIFTGDTTAVSRRYIYA